MGSNLERLVAGGIIAGVGLFILGNAGVGLRMFSVQTGYTLSTLGLPVLAASILFGVAASKGWISGPSTRSLPQSKVDYKFLVGTEGHEVLHGEPNDPGVQCMVKLSASYRPVGEFVVAKELYGRLMEGEEYQCLVKGNRIVEARHVPKS